MFSYSRWDILLIPWRLQNLQGWCLFHKFDLISDVGMADRGGFDRGFGGRGGRGDRGRGDRGRGRGRPRGGRKDDEEKWVPCTKLGRLVQAVRSFQQKQSFQVVLMSNARRVLKSCQPHQADVVILKMGALKATNCNLDTTLDKLRHRQRTEAETVLESRM